MSWRQKSCKFQNINKTSYGNLTIILKVVARNQQKVHLKCDGQSWDTAPYKNYDLKNSVNRFVNDTQGQVL